MLIQDAQNLKVSKNDVEKYAEALKSWPHFMVLSEKFDGDDVVKCFRIEGGRETPRPLILKKCSARYNKLSTRAVNEYLKDNTKPKKNGKKNGADEE